MSCTAVTITTGISGYFSLVRSNRPIPSRSAIIKSESINSNSSPDVRTASASMPEAACLQAYPAVPSMEATISRIGSSSSTTRIRSAMGIHESLLAIVTQRRDAESNHSDPETPSRNCRAVIFKSKEEVRPPAMNASLWSIWNTVAKLGLAKPTAAELALLILLGASLLALRAFRENYLKVWVVGWMAFVGSRLMEHSFAARIPAPFDLVVVQATFVLCVGLLAGAVLVYTRTRDLIVPLTVITPVLVGFAGARVLLWPDSLPVRVAVEVGYRLILLTASIALLRARRGRWEPSAWLLALSLPTLHLAWTPFTDRVPAVAFVAAEVALGLSMLLVVIDQARTRAKRLAVVQALTGNIVSAQQYGNMVQSAVEELRKLTKVRAAWFRLLEGRQLVATHAVGVSPDFLRDAGFAEVSEDLSKLLEKPEPRVSEQEDSGVESVDCLIVEKIHQVVMLPVVGKKAPIGLLLLGNSGTRHWTTEELDFLQTCALQLAIAVENFRLLEQVLRSQRQWMNTFDSIHDIILAHDADFKIVKANQVLLERKSTRLNSSHPSI